MARRSDHSRDQLFELMVAAAQEIITEEGIEGLTARRLAAAVGYSPGSIYNVFRNLDGLIVAVNSRTLDRLVEAFSAIPMTGTPEPDLAALLDCYLAFEEQNPKLWSALFDYDLREGEDWPDWYLAKIGQLFAMAERVFVPIYGPQPTRQSRIAIQTFWAGLHGITSLARSGTLKTVASETPTTLARHLARTYLAGLLASASPEQ